MTRVAVVGLGYAGLTLAVAFARKGLRVFGIDTDPHVVAELRARRAPFFEPGVEEALQSLAEGQLDASEAYPAEGVDAVVLCVPTPVEPATRRPDVESLKAAARAVAAHCGPETLAIVRSTVPVATTRGVVLPVFLAAWGRASLAFCPERTIQGQALRELEELPQVVGGLDEESRDRAAELFARLTKQIVPVSSLEAAELVKLVNNCHTDLIYSFGNEVALIAQRFALDPTEVIRAANAGYPRPDVARPGFVGGGCLSKDPYLLLDSARSTGHEPWLVSQARALNEYLPLHVARHFLTRLGEIRGEVRGSRILILGFAYKGRPSTDDLRGAPAPPIVDVLRAEGVRLLGHDYLVKPEAIRKLGVEPCALETGFDGADGVLVLTDHPGYETLHWPTLFEAMHRPALVYDCWRIVPGEPVRNTGGVHYAGIGHG